MPIASPGCVPVLLLTKWLLIKGSPDTLHATVLTGFSKPVFLTRLPVHYKDIRGYESTARWKRNIEWDAEQRTLILVVFQVQHSGRCKGFWSTNLEVLQTPSFGTFMEVSLVDMTDNINTCWQLSLIHSPEAMVLGKKGTESPHPLITRLAPLARSPHSKLSKSHFIYIKKTSFIALSQEIPRVFRSSLPEMGTETKYILFIINPNITPCPQFKKTSRPQCSLSMEKSLKHSVKWKNAGLEQLYDKRFYIHFGLIMHKISLEGYSRN